MCSTHSLRSAATRSSKSCGKTSRRYGGSLLSNPKIHTQTKRLGVSTSIAPSITVAFVFCGLKTVLDRPPMAFDRHQCFDGCSCWTPGGEEGEIAIGDTTTDQQTARPQTLICAVEFFGLEIGQFEITPIMQPRSFGSGPCRQAFPVGRAPRPADRP